VQVAYFTSFKTILRILPKSTKLELGLPVVYSCDITLSLQGQLYPRFDAKALLSFKMAHGTVK
jgi:hypothetical protein